MIAYALHGRNFHRVVVGDERDGPFFERDELVSGKAASCLRRRGEWYCLILGQEVRLQGLVEMRCPVPEWARKMAGKDGRL